jgi:hypothetical protein
VIDHPILGDPPHEPKWDAKSAYMTSVVRNLRESFPEYVGHNIVTDQDLINFYRYTVGLFEDEGVCIEEARMLIREQLGDRTGGEME